MDNKKEELSEKAKDFFDSIEFIPNEEVNNMNLMESCLYLEKLNMLDKLSNSNVGDNNE